jgi:hypothetical protein
MLNVEFDSRFSDETWMRVYRSKTENTTALSLFSIFHELLTWNRLIDCYRLINHRKYESWDTHLSITREDPWITLWLMMITYGDDGESDILSSITSFMWISAMIDSVRIIILLLIRLNVGHPLNEWYLSEIILPKRERPKRLLHARIYRTRAVTFRCTRWMIAKHTSN